MTENDTNNLDCTYNDAMLKYICSALHDIRQYLENGIKSDCAPLKGAHDEMAKINRCITIDGSKRWIRANTEQEYCDKLLSLSAGLAKPTQVKHNFKDYALQWFELCAKPTIETATQTTYKRQLDLYLIPRFGAKNIEDLTVADVQGLFNSMTGTKATKEKARTVLRMIFDWAIEDEYITKNPTKSKRLKVTGSASQETEPYTVAQMRYLVEHLDDVKSPLDRTYLALQALHPLRLEEVLGLKWADIDFENGVIHIRRAVTHPTRNQPEIKETKTSASVRDVGISKFAVKYLNPGAEDDFVLGGGFPLSYTRLRKICERVKRDTGFDESITPRRFRTTVLTDLYEGTHDIKQTQAAAGHTTSAMTLKYYVKGRGNAKSAAAAIDRAYTLTA